MEEVQVQSATPAPADTSVLPDAAASQSPNGDSEGQPPSQEEQNAYVNQVFRQAGRAITTSKPSSESEPAGESAPKGDVKPAEGQPERDPMGRFIPRRGVPEAVRTAEERASAAEAKLAETDPVKIREQVRAEIEAERQAKADADAQAEITRAQAAYDESYLGNEQTYREALHMADTDPRLGGPAPDGEGNLYTWREERKERRAQHVHVEKHYAKVADESMTERESAFLGVQRQQLQSVASLPGVDAEQVRKLGDYGEIGRLLYETGKAQGEAPLRTRVAELEQELSQYRLSGNRGLGSLREAVPAGRSGNGAGAPLNENAYMNNLFRGGPPRGN